MQQWAYGRIEEGTGYVEEYKVLLYTISHLYVTHHVFFYLYNNIK